MNIKKVRKNNIRPYDLNNRCCQYEQIKLDEIGNDDDMNKSMD